MFGSNVTPRLRGTLRCLAAALAMVAATVQSVAAAPSLDDFGFGHLTVGGARASGGRPLLVILANFNSPSQFAPNIAQKYQERIFGIGTPPGTVVKPNVADYFTQASGGKFTWTRAGKGVYGPYSLGAYDNEAPPLKTHVYIDTALKAVAQEGLDFRVFDRNNDKLITIDELSIIIIDNLGGNAGAGRPAIVTPLPIPQQGISLDLRKVSLISSGTNFTTTSHELAHLLGTVEMYGGNSFNDSYSLMSGTIGLADTTTFHLDPWHKLLLGWLKPSVQSMEGSGTATLSATTTVSGTQAAILYSPARGAGEYYLVEYRNAGLADGSTSTGYNYDRSGAHGGNGVAVWHVKTNGVIGENADLAVDYVSTDDPCRDIKSVFVAGAPSFSRGRGDVWSNGTTTQALTWLDGSGSNTHIKVSNPSSDGKTIQISWSTSPGGQVPRSTEVEIYGVDAEGNVQEFRHLDGYPRLDNDVPKSEAQAGAGTQWQGPFAVGNWSQYRTVVPAGGRARFFAIAPSGALDMLEQIDPLTGGATWKTATVGSAWDQFPQIVGGSKGVLYGIKKRSCRHVPGGPPCEPYATRWYSNSSYQTLGATWTGPKEVGTIPGDYQRIFSEGRGSLYGIDQGGALYHMCHFGVSDGTDDWGYVILPSGTVVPNAPVGSAWQPFKDVFPAGNGVIYAVNTQGDLVWYRHKTWEIHDAVKMNAWLGPVTVRSHWTAVKSVASLPDYPH